MESSINKTSSAQKSKSELLPLPKDYVPKYAIKEAQRFKKDFLLRNSKSASDLKHRFFYNDRGDACLEYTVTPKEGYKFAQLKWIGITWKNITGKIGNGEIKYINSKKSVDKAQYNMDERRKDFVFKEIEKEIFQIAKEYQYDFKSAYGINVKYRKPNIKKAVCGGYSDAVSEKLKNNSLIAKVESWSSTIGNHAWNVIILKDKRKLYCDVTWYQGNNIDSEGYVVDIPDRNPVNLTFNLDEFNSQGGAIDLATKKLLQVHFAWGDAAEKK